MATNELSFNRLVDWLDERLPAAEAAAVSLQVQSAIEQGDAGLKRTVDWIRAFRVLGRKPILAEPPAQARASVYALIQRRTAQAQPASLLRRIVASLLPPTSPGLAGASVRGNTSSLRQLTYASEVADIILNILPQPRTAQASLQGLVLPLAALDLNNVVVQLLRDGTEAGLTFTNEMGEFAFEALPSGSYTLVLGLSDADIEVGPLTLNSLA